VNFVGSLYSFGATLSFTVAHFSLVRLRMKQKGSTDVFYRARPNLLLRGVEWPLFAIVGGLATGASFLVIIWENPTTRWVGLGWIASGLAFYIVYRRRFVKASLVDSVKAPPAFGPALALEYRRLLVPVIAGQPSDDALDMACSLAAERGARIVAVNVLEVPLGRPLDADLAELEDAANKELDEAVAIGDSYGVRVIARLMRDRSAGKAIVEEAGRRGTEIIVIGTPRKSLTRAQRAVFGRTVDYVLRHAPCRVMVTASRDEVPA
jgi:APA family basic amino acid/polyamine antiporter